MNRFGFALALAWISVAAAQPAPQHLTVAPATGNRPVTLTALSIERGAEYPSVVKLRGKVEIKMPVCAKAGPGAATVCDGEILVRADEAEFYEGTGEIQPRGNVTVTPVRRQARVD